MKILSYDDFNPLREVIVGNAENANMPYLSEDTVTDIVFQRELSYWQYSFFRYLSPLLYYIVELFDFCFNGRITKFLCKSYYPIIAPGKKYPRTLVQIAKEEQDNLVYVLEKEGVKVYRPDSNALRALDHKWFNSANPRDTFLVIGNEIIEAPMAQRPRFFEHECYKNIFKNNFLLHILSHQNQKCYHHCIQRQNVILPLKVKYVLMQPTLFVLVDMFLLKDLL
jgi:hypothetical protein